MRLAACAGVERPVSALVQRVLHEEIGPDEAMRLLITREQKRSSRNTQYLHSIEADGGAKH